MASYPGLFRINPRKVKGYQGNHSTAGSEVRTKIDESLEKFSEFYINSIVIRADLTVMLTLLKLSSYFRLGVQMSALSVGSVCTPLTICHVCGPIGPVLLKCVGVFFPRCQLSRMQIIVFFFICTAKLDRVVPQKNSTGRATYNLSSGMLRAETISAHGICQSYVRAIAVGSMC